MSRKSVISLLIGIPVLSALALFMAIPVIIRLYQELSGRTAEPRPPDLAECTPIEIEYRPSIQERFFGAADWSLLNAEEQQYVRSLKSIALTDPNDILMLSDALASAEYQGVVREPVPIHVTEYDQITGYVDSCPNVSCIIWGPRMTVKYFAHLSVTYRRAFRLFYNDRLLWCRDTIASRNVPFQRRLFCAAQLKRLRSELNNAMGSENRYPAATKWCDVMEEYKRARYPRKESVTWSLKCPAQKGRCHYAMNPNCEPNSPPDIVLLFETTAGWNQHGGQELFTFDNHDPRGGCVLLNDGTVKFIRAKEELKQLRWE